MPMTPLCNPYDFLYGSRDKSRLCELSHTACNQRTYNAAFCIKFIGGEGKRIALAVRQRRQMREPLRIIQHADHPKMIESALRTGRIIRMERDRHRAAGTVERCHFGPPEIVGLHRPTEFHRFHNQRRKFRYSGAHVETTSAPFESPSQYHGDSAPETVAESPLHSPEFFAAFITVDRS